MNTKGAYTKKGNNQYNGNRSSKNKQQKYVTPLDKPLSVIYSDKKKIFLQNGIAYQTAQKMGKVPSHQLRKILNEVKRANAMCKKSDDKFEDARNILYYIVPLTGYNAARNPTLESLYEFVVQHINENTLTNSQDIEILDQLFTSIIAYHKYLSGEK